MTQTEIKRAFRDIGLALNLLHQTMATDRPDLIPIIPPDISWQVDHDKELGQLAELEKFVLENIGDVWVSLN